MKKLPLFFLALFFVFLSGCSDYNELNMQALVRNVGIDYENGEILVCVACEGGQEGESIIKKARGKSFFEAVRSLSETSDKKLYWGHLQTVVFGEKALREAFGETLDTLSRVRDVYPDVIPVATVGLRAEDVISHGEETLGAFSNEKNSRRFAEVPIWEVSRDKELYGVSVIPTIRKEENPELSVLGGAVVSDDGVRGSLSGEELLLLTLLAKDGAGGYLPTIEISEASTVSFEVLANSIKTRREGEKFIILQKITVSPAEIRGEISRDEMKNVCKEYLEDGYKRLIIRQREEKLGNILKVYGADMNSEITVRTDVTVSNVFGGK